MSREFQVSLCDSLGGVRLEDMTLETWQCPDPSIRNLDIWRAPLLKELDLSWLHGGLHLTLVGCPRLQKILLPQGEPCVLHLDASDVKPGQELPLLIQGGIEHLDVRWQNATFMAQAPEDQPWQGAWVASSKELAAPSALEEAAPDLLLLKGKVPAAEIELPGHSLSQVHWVHPQGLQRLLLQVGEKLQQVVIQGAEDLQHCQLEGSMKELRLEACPALSQLHVAVDSLNLHQVGAKSLQIQGRVEQLFVLQPSCQQLAVEKVLKADFSLSDGLKQVDLPTGCEVTCQGRVPASLRKTARVHVNEATVRQLLDEYAGGDSSVVEDLESLLPFMSSSEQLPSALRLLHELLLAGASPQWVWDLRMKISARHLGESRSKKSKKDSLREAIKPNWLVTAKQNWRWHLPRDLGDDAWLLDWKIWLACREVQGVRKYARLFSEVMVNSTLASEDRHRQAGSGPHFNQWLLHWLNTGDLAYPEVQQLCSRVLKSLMAINKPMNSVWNFGIAEPVKPLLESRLLNQAQRFLATLDEEPELLLELHDYQVHSMPVREVLIYLQEQLKRQPEQTRVQILRLAVKPAEFWQGRASEMQLRSLPRQLRVLALTGQLPQASEAVAT
ncbi:hypothetical protein SAMN05660443_0647 [Marinospirillum celere]|uniref:Uncharacterized protein n=1 Tax=Marinospirillum celere TaxID=1122252 RepID=A0A1I1EKU0_9GAMM|nr:hypothetical protein [Marinospirillum celere]SFB87232.1 hypothetical protein SAMN05660443_0647 [Marinospirillum celere]